MPIKMTRHEKLVLKQIESGNPVWAWYNGGPVEDVDHWSFWFWVGGAPKECSIVTRRLIKDGRLRITKDTLGYHWVELNPEKTDD